MLVTCKIQNKKHFLFVTFFYEPYMFSFRYIKRILLDLQVFYCYIQAKCELSRGKHEKNLCTVFEFYFGCLRDES